MNFIYERATVLTLTELGVSEKLQNEIKDIAFFDSLFIAYNLFEKVALIPGEADPFSLTSMYYTLIIKGYSLGVSETRVPNLSENSIKVFLNKDSEHLDDQMLSETVTNALFHFIGERIFKTPITVVRPKVQKIRTPEMLIKLLNQVAKDEVVIPGSENLANSIIRSLISKDERDTIIQLEEAYNLPKLSPNARKMFTSAFVKP